jgi:hypothetical protein
VEVGGNSSELLQLCGKEGSEPCPTIWEGEERSGAAAHRAGGKGGGGGLKSDEVERAPAAGHSTTEAVEGEEGGTLVWLIFGVEKGEGRRELGAALLWLR